MDELRLSSPACIIAGKMCLTIDDIAILREDEFSHGLASGEDAATLVALNRACPEKCSQWADYFIGEMTHFIVHHCYPQGAMDEINTRWLIALISRDGVVSDELERELLRHVIDASRSVPASLSLFALRQVTLSMEERGMAGQRRYGQISIRDAMRERDFQRRLVAAILRVRDGQLSEHELFMLGRTGYGHPVRWHLDIAA